MGENGLHRARQRTRRPVAGVVAATSVALLLIAGGTAFGVGADEPSAPSTQAAEPPSATIVPNGDSAGGSSRAQLHLPAPTAERFTIAFTGDVLVHQSVWEAAAAAATDGRRFDFRPLLAPVRSIIAGADLAICHLETPLSPDDSDLSSYPVFNVPHEVAPALKWAGFDGCSTASNHSLDQGTDGIDATLDALDRAGLEHAGTVRTRAEAARITAYDVGGVTVAHLSYSFGFNGYSREHEWQANLIEPERIVADARRARADGAALVVVSLHCCVEYQHLPTGYQQEVAHSLAASHQVDLIVGHHAHVVQPIARVGRMWVAYGLGNFLSSMTSSLGTAAVEDGVILLADVERRGEGYAVADLRYVPTWVEYGAWRVVPVQRALAGRVRNSASAATLRASLQRTRDAIDLLGADDLGVRSVA